MARRWKELLFRSLYFFFPGLLLAPDRLLSDTLSSVDGYPPERASPRSTLVFIFMFSPTSSPYLSLRRRENGTVYEGANPETSGGFCSKNSCNTTSASLQAASAVRQMALSLLT